MIQRIKILRLFFLTSFLQVLGLVSCESPYAFEIESQDFIVVDGFISENARFTEVVISYSSSYELTNSYRPIGGLKVYMVSDFDERYLLKDRDNNGRYTPAEKVKVDPELYYWIEFTFDNKNYYSKPEQTTPSLPFEILVVDGFVNELNDKSQIKTVSGFEVNVQVSKNPSYPNNTTFVKWDWYGRSFIQSLGEAYFDNPKNYVNVMDYDNYLRSELTEYFITFRPEYTLPLDPYELTVAQKTITKNAYDYWSSIAEQTALTGGIFDSRPETLSGNVQSSDKNEIVLGYVMIGDVSVKTIELR